MYLYLERDGHRAWHPPPRPPPLPAGEACTFPSPAPAGEEGVGAGADLGKGLGRGKKEIFIFEPLCLFCLRLKDGKTKRVCLLLVFLCPLPLLGMRSQGLPASFHLALPRSWGSGKGKPQFPIHRTGNRMGQEEGRRKADLFPRVALVRGNLAVLNPRGTLLCSPRIWCLLSGLPAEAPASPPPLGGHWVRRGGAGVSAFPTFR